MRIIGKSNGEDSGSLNPNNQVSNLQQRTTFYCVPIPGETEWVKNVLNFSFLQCIIN